MNKEIDIQLLHAHPLNRHFERIGEKWQAMVESVRTHGVLQPLLVRQTGGKVYQIIAGHRRVAAAQEAGLQLVECIVRKMSDREALELLVIENLEREDPDPVEEGRLLRALEAEGVEPEVLAHRLKRSVAWIVTRQRLLDLGEEVLEAVRKPKDAAGHLGMGTVEILLSVADSDRPRAIQMVLHPEWTEEVLGPREAAEVIRSAILEPARRKAAWEKESKSLVKAWRKSLATFLNKEERADLVVQPLRFEEVETCRLKTPADGLIPDEELYTRGEPVRWVHLAVRHGLPVWVVPEGGDGDGDESSAVVDERLIRMAEEARVAGGLVATLLTARQLKQRKAGRGGSECGGDEPAGDGEPAPAGAGPAPADETAADEEPPTTVIEQTMESRAWVDLGPVRRIKELIAPLEWPGDDVPADLPDWLHAIWDGQYGAQEIIMLCDWILDLRR